MHRKNLLTPFPALSLVRLSILIAYLLAAGACGFAPIIYEPEKDNVYLDYPSQDHDGYYKMEPDQYKYYRDAKKEIKARSEANNNLGHMDRLRLECEDYYESLIAGAPKPSKYTSAAKLLRQEKNKACAEYKQAQKKIEDEQRRKQALIDQKNHEQQEEQRKAEEHERWLHSPAGLLSRACEIQSDIQNERDIIARENLLLIILSNGHE